MYTKKQVKDIFKQDPVFKNAFIQAICSYLPHNITAYAEMEVWESYAPPEPNNKSGIFEITTYDGENFYCGDNVLKLESIRLILRPLNTMTQEECDELSAIVSQYIDNCELPDENSSEWGLYDTTGIKNLMGGTRFYFNEMIYVYDWLNKHHFDYRGLIDRGFATAK